MNVRLRRLQADWESVRRAVSGHPKIEIAGTAGKPPQRYHILYRLKSLVEKPDGEIVDKHEHLAEITLTRSYPRQPPVCRMLTPVFHPNIAPHVICIGDHWSAGESLVQLIFRIGEMLAFQSYNVKSPLNGLAAQWVQHNLHHLPIDDSVLTTSAPEEAGQPQEPKADEEMEMPHFDEPPSEAAAARAAPADELETPHFDEPPDDDEELEMPHFDDPPPS